ncbi:hypothetical protein [Nodularia sp. LEGE 04288]|uniref:hypothetical protein n=1 Tax=Nodularia sp. LEGE 04288 TaxID=1828639 RepID=UPI001D1008E0|nr:hypothetical protein [Nodularia sp. LEGE 04288]MCC2695844.1 hypothetical protein [Nodularia sp. LEGE 04288]
MSKSNLNAFALNPAPLSHPFMMLHLHGTAISFSTRRCAVSTGLFVSAESDRLTHPFIVQ